MSLILTPQDIRKREFWEPCTSREELYWHIKTFLKIDLPQYIVDERSTSTPLDFIWSVYETMLTNAGSMRHVVATSRNCMKTLSSAIIHFYSIIHFRRDTIQLAAIRPQSLACIRYLDKFLTIDEVKPYSNINNKDAKLLSNMPPNYFTIKHDAKVQVAVGTLEGVNSLRGSCFTGKTKININEEIDVSIKHIYDNFPYTDFYVKSYNFTHFTIDSKKVEAVQRRENKKRIIFRSYDFTETECTLDHYLYSYAEKEYKQAKDFKGNDFFLGLDNKPKRIMEIEITNNGDDPFVYDIQVADNHNFFANGVLVHNCILYDEVELIDPMILSEAANMADPTQDSLRFDPISIYLSSRKFTSGVLQQLTEEAERPLTEDERDDGVSRPKLHKWSVADFMQRCPPELHRPNEPKIKAYINTNTLQIKWGEIDSLKKVEYLEISAFAGCKSCSAFVVCQARSVNQKGDSPSLRTPKFVAGRVRDTRDAKKIISQLLNWKPESSGLVYPTFEYSKHVRNAINSYNWINHGVVFNPHNLTAEAYDHVLNHGNIEDRKLIEPNKLILYKLLIDNGWKVNWGVDWGYTDPASVIVTAYNMREKRCFIVHVDHKTGYANQDWTSYICKTYLPIFSPDLVCPDMADAACPTYFAKHGVNCLTEKPTRIETGVSQIRSLLWNVERQEADFCVLEDPNNLFLIEEFGTYTHERSQQGFNFDKFDKDGCQVLDSLRYALMPFIESTDVLFRASQRKEESLDDLFEQARNSNDIDVQIRLAKKQMDLYFKQKHGLVNVFSEEKKFPTCEPIGRPTPTCELIEKQYGNNHKKGGFFFNF